MLHWWELSWLQVSLGGLTSPLWGSLADRYRTHRLLLAVGMLFASIALAAFAFTTQPAIWIPLAVIEGLGTASAATIANLFVVEAHPQPEWDQRIGWLQTFLWHRSGDRAAVGRVLSQTDFRIGLWVAAGLGAFAAILGWLTTKTPPAQPGLEPLLIHPVKHAESTMISPQRLFHAPKWVGIGDLGRTLRSPFGVFLAAWLLAFAGPAAVFLNIPFNAEGLWGHSRYFLGCIRHHRCAGPDSLYPGWQLVRSSRSGAHFTDLIGIALDCICWNVLVGFHAGQWSHRPAGLDCFCLRGLGLVSDEREWHRPGGTPFTYRRGSGAWVFNAITAAAGIIGALLAGWAAGVWGYGSIVALALIGVALGLGLSLLVDKKVLSEKKETK